MTAPEHEPRFLDTELDVWYDDTERLTKTVVYSDFDGGSPENTNHLSDRTRYVVAGEGVMTISGVEIAFTEGDEVIVPKGVSSVVKGKASMITTFEPILAPRFVTLGDEKLSRKNTKLLKSAEKTIRRVQNPLTMESVAASVLRYERLFSHISEGMDNQRMAWQLKS